MHISFMLCCVYPSHYLPHVMIGFVYEKVNVPYSVVQIQPTYLITGFRNHTIPQNISPLQHRDKSLPNPKRFSPHSIMTNLSWTQSKFSPLKYANKSSINNHNKLVHQTFLSHKVSQIKSTLGREQPLVRYSPTLLNPRNRPIYIYRF